MRTGLLGVFGRGKKEWDMIKIYMYEILKKNLKNTIFKIKYKDFFF